MWNKNLIPFRNTVTFLISIFFLLNNVSSAIDISPTSDITPALVGVDEPLTPEAVEFQKSLFADSQFRLFFSAVAAFYLNENVSPEEKKNGLKRYLDKIFGAADQYVPAISIKSLDDIKYDPSDRTVTVPFIKGAQRAVATMRRVMDNGQGDEGYALKIEPVSFDENRDLKGEYAQNTDPLIRDLIKEGKVLEVYLDEKTSDLKANRVCYTADYLPGITPRDEYIGSEIKVTQFLTNEAVRNLIEWMKEHKIRGAPVKFRVVLGDTAIGWQDDVEHSNIAHAGLRDKCIYVGGIFFDLMFQIGNESLREQVLDNDEFQHLLGNGHGSDKEYQVRKDLVEQAIKAAKLDEFGETLLARGLIMQKNDELEGLSRAYRSGDVETNIFSQKEKELKLVLGELHEMEKKSVYFFRDEILARLDDPAGLFTMLYALNQVAVSKRSYPVEITYPVKQAVALLDKKDKDRLIAVLMKECNADCRKIKVVDEILLMLTDDNKLENWVDVHAPYLKGRSFWQISPEIWHEAGGLARVMQYHGVGIAKLLEGSDVRFRQIEPHYQNRISPDGTAVPLDYTKDLTHSIRPETMEKVAEFKVIVMSKEVDVEVAKGINDLGIETYLIKDKKGFYTHSLYNYRRPWEAPDLPTWEEFSTFYSKASVELVRLIEEKEKSEKEKEGKTWKAPFLHTNDSQTALVSPYVKLFRKNDPVLQDAAVCFTTHTYNNRGYYGLDQGIPLLEAMGIPKEYWRSFEHLQNGKSVIDMASGGIRWADWQGAVSWMHALDVKGYDEWYSRFPGFDVNLVAVSNGDNRVKSAIVFRDLLRREYGAGADVEHPTPEQIQRIKKIAKAELRLAKGQDYYTSHEMTDKEKENGEILNADQPVVSYSGRLVPEKAGRARAFTDENIEALVANGVQVVIYGNVQTKSDTSVEIADQLRDLARRLKAKHKGKEGAGRLVFVPRFYLHDQRALLAATDIQVQDSDARTEGAGYTEADVSVNGGLQLAPPREGVGEGLLKAQGLPLDLSVPGMGNTLIPRNWQPEAYREILLKVLSLGPEALSRYQATSVRLSRPLEAILTSRAYLVEFNNVIARKEAEKEAERKMEERQKMFDEENSLLNMITRPDPENEPEEYSIFETARLTMTGNTREAVLYFFTNPAFQGRTERLTTVACVFNKLLDTYRKDRSKKDVVKRFLNDIRHEIVDLSGNKNESVNLAKSVQLMAGQALTVLSWIDRGIEVAGDIRLTADTEKELKSDGTRWRSFIDKTTLPENVPEAVKEGTTGFYWRGIEGVAKIGDKNISDHSSVRFDNERYAREKDKVVMYLMDHGFVPVPEGLKEATAKGEISTIHETYFVQDTLPGSYQTTSTGAGHYQGNKLDIKYVTEGRGVQVNVKYDENNNIVEVVAQEVTAGCETLALPGYVDYMINLGGLRFNDISITLSDDMAKGFNPDYREDLEVKPVLAPYAGIKTGLRSTVMETMVKLPENVMWLDRKGSYLGENDLLVRMYENTSSMAEMMTLVDGIARDYLELLNNAKREPSRIEIVKNPFDYVKKTASPGSVEPASFNGISGIQKFLIDDNEAFLSQVLSAGEGKDKKLVRLPVQLFEIAGEDNVKGFVEALQSSGRCYAELFDITDPAKTVNVKAYPYIKEAPRDFKSDRTNTITILPVLKGEELPTSGVNKRWKDSLGGLDLKNTVISPIGWNYDEAGLIRSVFLGLRLTEIAKNKYAEDNVFVAYTLAQYMDFCMSQGIKSFDLTAKDLLNIADGNVPEMVASLNKLIKLLPIMPVNTEELRAIYQHAKEALIRA